MGFFKRRARSWSAWLVLTAWVAVACGSDSDGSPDHPDGAGGDEGGAAATEGGDGGTDKGGGTQADAGVNAVGAGAGGDTQLGFIGRLEHLGAKTDLPPDPLDGDDKPLPGGYHPLKKAFATIDPQQEIYYSGPLLGAQREGMLNDGFTGGFGPLLNAQFTPWLTATYRTAVAGDFDGDGIQEFAAVYYDAPAKKLMAKMIWGPRGTEIAYDDEPFALADIVTPSNMPDDWFQHSVASGNVDDDPADELWVGFQNLYVFDDIVHRMAELHREDYDTPYVAVTKGDFDAALGDSLDEFMVMYTVFPGNEQHFQVFDGLQAQFEAGGRILRPTLTDAAKSEIALHQGFAIAGEFDGDDPEQEIAILSGNDDTWRLMIMDDAHAKYRTFDSMSIDMTGDNVMLAAADIDGDGIDEVACDRWIFDHLEALPQSGDRTEQSDIHQGALIPRISTGIFAYQMRGASVTPDYGVPARRTRQFVALEWGGRLLYSARNPTNANQLAWVSLGDVSQQRIGDVLAVGNVDDDSPVVKFTGDHELLYSQPELLVAMAAPPFYADSNQPANTYTSFGQGTADSVEHESSVGFSVGFSLGYESRDPLGIVESSFKVSVNQEFDSFAKSKSTLSQWVTYTTGAEDSVVFSVVPFDVYYYEVISAPDPGQVGKTLSINLPRAPQTLLASAEYFDQFVDETRKSAPLFATHVVGEPLSYSDVDERDALCRGDCFKSKGTISVGQGTGWMQIDIGKTKADGVGTSYKLSTEVSSEASLFGVSVGSSVGFSYGYGLELTTEETTMFTGRVGSLKGLTPDNGYDFGLFAHRQTHPASIKPILVVDYWVVQ